MCSGRVEDNGWMDGSNCHQYVQRKSEENYNSECLQPLVKHGGGSVLA